MILITLLVSAQVLLSEGRYQEALEQLKDATSAQDLANRCTAKYKLADYKGAAADCERAVKLQPKLKPVLKGQASDAYYRLGSNEDLYKAVRWDRGNPLPYLELGRRALAQKQHKAALRYLDRSITADPANPEAFLLRAQAAELAGRRAQAERDRRRASELSK